MVNLRVSERLDGTASYNKRPNFLAVPNVHNVRVNSTNYVTDRVRLSSTWKARKRRTRKTKKWITFFRQPWERYITAIVYLLALAILSYMIFDETDTYRRKPTSTAVEDDKYPVQKISFPAIAICNLNILSRHKVANFARELWQMEKLRRVKNITLEKLEDLLKYMGHVYTFSNWETNPGDIKLLEQVFTQVFGPEYNIGRIMEHILPQCRSHFEHCSWGGEIRSCEELFVPRWTHEGRCCIFNYVRWADTISSDGKTDYAFHMERAKYAGYEYGLRVFLNPHFDDNYYNLLPARGFKVMVFTATDYPDTPSGGLKEIIVGPGTEKLIKVKGTAFYSSPDVIKFDKSKRQCLFSTELEEEYGGTYSYSQCLLLCRSRDIFRTCSCVPFFYPYPIELKNVRDCTVLDLDCLKVHRYKWWSVKPVIFEAVKHSWDKNEENLACDCLPSCEAVDFSVFVTGSDIHHEDINFVDFVENYSPDNVTKDTILLTISFGHPTITRLRQDVMYYWYDLMSAYGGLCSLFLGVSILKPIEFIYELCVRMWDKRNKTYDTEESAKVPTIAELKKIPEQPIYWKEFIRKN